MPDATESSSVPASRPSRRGVYLTAGLVLLLSLGLRLWFSDIVYNAHDAESFARIHSDTREYVRLGERVKVLDQYTMGNNFAVSRGLVRPPGYPTLYAIFDRIGFDVSRDLRRIVWPQAILCAFGPLAAYGIAFVIFRRLIPATIVGILAAISPTGLATVAIAMPDGLFGACFTIAFLGLVALTLAAPSRPLLIAWIAGIELAFAALLKPAAIYWPILAVPLFFLLRGVNRASIHQAVGLFLPMLIVVGGWTVRNYAMWGVPSYSIIGMKNIRYFVMPRVQLEAELGRPPTLDEWIKRSNAIGDADTATLRQRVDWPTLPMLIRQQTDEAFAPLRQHPLIAARVMASNLVEQLDSRWKKAFHQLPREGKRKALHARVRGPFLIGDSPWIVWPYYTLLLLAVPTYALLNGRGPTLAGLALCFAAYAYIVLPTATVAYEGSRLLFAGEAMGLVLVIAPVWLAIQWMGARRRV